MALTRELQPIAESLKSWESNESDLLHVWIYGSHAKGQASPESDLDVAVEVITRDGETCDDVYSCSAEEWRSQLAPRMAPRKLDLKLYDKSGRREKVRRAVDEHGILVYVNRMEEPMNTKRWLLASVAVFVVIMVLEFVINGVLLSGMYQQTAAVWRTQAEMQSMMWIFWVGYLVFAPFFALIYAKGYEKGKPGLGQGFRFGLYVGAMLCVMHGFGWYVILPIPLALSFYWFLAILVEFIAAGVAAGLVYQE